MNKYYAGNGYSVSTFVDLSGVPLLSWRDPNSGRDITLFDRVACQFDPTAKAPRTLDQIYNARMDAATSAALKQAIGGTSSQELDHIISLELGGSNELANLSLDPGATGTVLNATDTYENQLSAAIQAGSMSLLDAWRAIAKAKGKVLAEDLQYRTNSNWATAASSALGAVYKILTGSARGTLNANLQAQIKQDLDVLAAKPYDLATRNKIFTEQIDLTAQQLNLSKTDAAAYMKVYTAKYAQTQGQNPNELLGALTANEQKLIGISNSNPNLLGIDNTIWANVAAAFVVGAGVVGIFGIIAFIIALFTAAPEEAAVAVTGVGVASFLAGLGVPAAAIGAFATTEAIAGGLLAFSFVIPMATKQLIDAKYIVPSLIASALKDDIAGIKAQGGGTSTTKKTTTSSVSSFAPSGAPAQHVVVGTVSSGTLGPAVAFTPHESNIIETASELAQAAAVNLSAFFTSLPGKLVYEIKLAPHVIADDGTLRVGGQQTVQTGTTKKGVAKFKTIKNKFAIADIFYNAGNGKRIKIIEVNLGPVDETNFVPSEADLAAIASSLTTGLVKTTTTGITTVAPGSSGVSVAAPSGTDAVAGSLTDASAAAGGGPAATATALAPVGPTAEQIAARNKPIPFTVLYPTTGIFHNSGGFGEEISKRVGPTLWRLSLINPPFDTLYKGVVGAGAQAAIVDQWLKDNFGFDINALPQFNYADLSTDRTITHDAGFTNPGEPGAGTTDPRQLMTVFFAQNAAPAGSTQVILNSPGASGAQTSGTKTGVCAAATLTEFYAAQGTTVPSLPERGLIYQSLGLGTASLYSGTANENAKLLAALQQQAGCAV